MITNDGEMMAKQNFKSDPDHNIPFRNYKAKDAGDDISLNDLLEFLWRGKKQILIFVALFFLIGSFHYIASPIEYSSKARLLQETEQSSVADGIRLLGQLGGVNFGGTRAQRYGIPPDIYPEIIESVDFQYDLLFTPVTFSTLNERITLYDYFNNHYEIPLRTRVYRRFIDYTLRLPVTLYRFVRSSFSATTESHELAPKDFLEGDVLSLSPEFAFAMNQLVSRINLNDDNLILEVEIRLPDPLAASQLNLIITERIREYVTQYRSEKARQNLLLVERLHEESRERYENAQKSLASFTDRNQGNLTATATIERDRLQDDRNLTFNLYSSISQRLEEAKIRLQEDTPIFTILQLPILPNAPQRTSLLVIPAFIIIGIIAGIGWIVMIRFYHIARSKIVEFDSKID